MCHFDILSFLDEGLHQLRRSQQDVLGLHPHVLLPGLVAGYVLLLFAPFAAQGLQSFLEGAALHVFLRELVGDAELVHRAACQQGLWQVRLDVGDLSVEVLVELLEGEVAGIAAFDHEAGTVGNERGEGFSFGSRGPVVTVNVPSFCQFQTNFTLLPITRVLFLELLEANRPICHFGNGLDEVLRVQFKSEVLFDQLPHILNGAVAFLRLIALLPEIGIHNFRNYFTIFVLFNEDIPLPDPLHLVSLLPQKHESPDHIRQYLQNPLVAEHMPPAVEHPQVGLEGISWLLKDGIDVGDKGAKVVGLHGMRIDQSDHMRTLVLLELAELNQELVMLLRGVRHHLLHNEPVLRLGGEQAIGGQLADGVGVQKRI